MLQCFYVLWWPRKFPLNVPGFEPVCLLPVHMLNEAWVWRSEIQGWFVLAWALVRKVPRGGTAGVCFAPREAGQGPPAGSVENTRTGDTPPALRGWKLPTWPLTPWVPRALPAPWGLGKSSGTPPPAPWLTAPGPWAVSWSSVCWSSWCDGHCLMPPSKPQILCSFLWKPTLNQAIKKELWERSSW